MKTFKKVLASALAAAMVVTAFPVTNAEAATAPKLSATKATLYVGQSKTITVKNLTSTWKGAKVVSASDKKSVATVSRKGNKITVKAVKAGTAKVTVKVTPKKGAAKKLTAKITVKTPSVKFTSDVKEIKVGEQATVKATSVPATSVKYYSADKSIATVGLTSGKVTGKAAGTVKVAAVIKTGSKTTKAYTEITVVDDTTLTITSLEATAADTLVAKFANVVDAANATVTLKKGTTTQEIKTAWDVDAKTLTITTPAKMTAGTYELTVTDKNDATKTTSKTVDVTAQKATTITILNDVALTGVKAGGPAGNSQLAYVYYDVLDQYGTSMRSSVSIDWSSSVKVANKNAATGLLTLERTDGKDFTYGEQIFITGVNTKTGLNVNKTLTVGAKQAVNSVTIGGFIKKGTTDILTSLPKDFKSDAYYMLYNVVDQNGNDMKTGRWAANATIEDITFVSDSPLVIKEMTKAGSTVVIKDHEYDTVLVEPGIKVEQGGEVNVTAIANKTGNKTTLNVPVNVSEVLKSFVIDAQSDIIADGEGAELSFTATDTKGNKITNFETIAKQVTFNKLQLTASTGVLKFVQQNDGTAKLTYQDPTMAWSDSQSTDGQDRIVSLTAIVVGGDTANQMLNISDKARPTGVKDIAFNSAYVEGDSVTVELTDTKSGKTPISYVDQYGRSMEATLAAKFFKASKDGDLKGTDFAGYTFGTMVTYVGNGISELTGASKIVSDTAKDVFLTDRQKTVSVKMGTKVKAAVSGEGVKAYVAKEKAGEYSALDNAKYANYSVVDITKVNVEAPTISKIYVNTNNSAKDYLVSGTATAPADGANILPAYQEEVKLTGTYAGQKVNVPTPYYKVTGKKVTTRYYALGNNKINAISGSALTWGDLYDYTSAQANYKRKDCKDTLTVNVFELYDNDTTVATFGNALGTPKAYTEINKDVLLSDEAPKATTLTANAEAVTFGATHTSINMANLDATALAGKKVFVLKDQYGRDFSGIKYEVKDVKEVAAYADNNFTVLNNASAAASVNGAELGDTFTLVGFYGTLSAKVAVTVGADSEAYISSQAGNVYLDTLVNGTNGLEAQRVAGLK